MLLHSPCYHPGLHGCNNSLFHLPVHPDTRSLGQVDWAQVHQLDHELVRQCRLLDCHRYLDPHAADAAHLDKQSACQSEARSHASLCPWWLVSAQDMPTNVKEIY